MPKQYMAKKICITLSNFVNWKGVGGLGSYIALPPIANTVILAPSQLWINFQF